MVAEEDARVAAMDKSEMEQRLRVALRRLQYMSNAINDTVRPWLGGGRAEEIVSKETCVACRVNRACNHLMGDFRVSESVLSTLSDSLEELVLRCGAGQDEDDPSEDTIYPSEAGFYLEAQEVLKRIEEACSHAKEMATLIRNVLAGSIEDFVKDTIRTEPLELQYVIDCLDYCRWQMVKHFSHLVAIFDDGDTPDSNEPNPAWTRDKLGREWDW
jgi:hypothetical protein